MPTTIDRNMSSLPPDLLVGRQPILDRDQSLVAYELIFRTNGGVGPDAATVGEVLAATALERSLGRLPAWLAVDAGGLMDEALARLPAERIVLLLDFDAAPSPETVERCRALRASGFRLALAWRPDIDAAALPFVDALRIDATLDDASLADLLARFPSPPLRLAGKVDSRERMEECRTLGFDLFQGFGFARPQVAEKRPLSASQMSIVRLLNLVARDAESGDLEENFKREPALTVNLLRLVNAVGSGQTHKVDSLRQAIVILGRKQLLRWLQLLLMAAPGAAAPERDALLQYAAMRGHLLEILARRCLPGNRAIGDEAFLAGVMSLMPAALGLTMEAVLAQIPVVENVGRALAGREGTLGRLLKLVESLDERDWSACDVLIAEVPELSHETLARSLSEALAWIHGDPEDAG